MWRAEGGGGGVAVRGIAAVRQLVRVLFGVFTYGRVVSPYDSVAVVADVRVIGSRIQKGVQRGSHIVVAFSIGGPLVYIIILALQLVLGPIIRKNFVKDSFLCFECFDFCYLLIILTLR